MKNPRHLRLEREREELAQLCDNSKLISYEAVETLPGVPPEEYEVEFKVKSIVAVDDENHPIYGEKHKLKVTLPPTYPMTSAPRFTMLTDVWHPNIRSEGDWKGHVCINAEVFNQGFTMDSYVLQIGEMLQWKNYHAQDVKPHPEDPKVALWVREFAEPNNIVNKAKGIYVDERPLREESDDWKNSRKEKQNGQENRDAISKEKKDKPKKEKTEKPRRAAISIKMKTAQPSLERDTDVKRETLSDEPKKKVKISVKPKK